jgi:hypothetical protein
MGEMDNLFDAAAKSADAAKKKEGRVYKLAPKKTPEIVPAPAVAEAPAPDPFDLTPAPVANIVQAINEADVEKYVLLGRRIAELEQQREAISDDMKRALQEGKTRIGAYEVTLDTITRAPSVEWKDYVSFKGMKMPEFIEMLMKDERTAGFVRRSAPYKKISKVEKI